MFEVLFCGENGAKNTHGIKKKLKSFDPHNSNPAADRQMGSRTFLNQIQFQTTFIRSFFDAMRIFDSIEP